MLLIAALQLLAFGLNFVGGASLFSKALLFRLRGGEVPMYENNGGTVVAIAGDTFAVIGADTRLSKGYSILSRNYSRLHEVSPGVWLGVAGCHADVTALVQVLRATVTEYECSHGRAPPVDVISQALSVILYQRRGMPYYCFCVLAGVDAGGRGAVFNYDAVGSFERVATTAVGGSQAIILPILDGLSGQSKAGVVPKKEGDFLVWNRSGRSPGASPPGRCVSGLTCEEAISGLSSALISAAERDIRLGDRLEVVVVEGGGVGRVTSCRKPDLQLKQH